MPAPGKVASSAAFSCALLLCAAALPAQSPATGNDERSSFSAPIELIHDKPYVAVMVNGHGPYRFLVDTGTGTEALVSPELANELSLPVVGHARLTDPSGQGKQRSDIRLMHLITIGGADFAEVKAVRHKLYGGDENCQGVLGFTLFKDYLLTLNFPERRLVLSRGAIEQDGGGSVIAFRLQDGVPVIPLRIDGRHLEGQVDSGGTGLSLPESVAARVKFLSTPIVFGSGESLATRFAIRAARLRPDVRLGHYAFRQAFVEINPAFPLVNVGATPLKRFVVTFDQAHMLVRLFSKEKTLHLDASPSQLELTNAPTREASARKLVPVG